MSTNRTRPDKGFVRMEDLPRGPNGRILCRYCETEVEPPRRTFCSEVCVHNFKIQSNPGYARTEVAKRDRGVCSGCALDTEQLQKVLHQLMVKNRREYDRLTRWYLAVYGFGFRIGDHFWEMDHVQAVVNGGGSCGLDNLQTLCVPCHRRKTRVDLSKSYGRQYATS